MALTIQEQIAQQEKSISDTKKKIAALRTKAKEKETKRFQKIGEKVGYFDLEITDQQLESALRTLVESVKTQGDKTAS